MKKLKFILGLIFVGIFSWSCGNSDGNSSETSVKNTSIQKQAITEEMIVGEWECIDITNGITHMQNIAKMQPHMVFSNDGKIYMKKRLSDGNFMKQKYANYKIEDGVLKSEAFEESPYIENKQLIFGSPSEDDKRIYTKIGEIK